MIDKEEILKISQENKLDYDFVELYFEELEKIFKTSFCFTEKKLLENVTKIFKSNNEEAVMYFYEIFQKYSTLLTSSKDLTETEKIYRKQSAEKIVTKALELYKNDNKRIRQEFFDALKEAESYGIDPYKISNKTTFKNLTVESFKKSLYALVEETYIDTNTNKEFRLFEEMEDVKAMFEECSSEACKFNAEAIQNVLELLSNFTYDKEHNVFYGNVNYVNMIRKCKGILTQPLSKLEDTMAFLELYFVDEKDPSSKIDLLKKIDEDPAILLLSPDKVTDLEKKLISLGLSEEKAKAFCFNKDNLIQINGISQQNMSNLGLVKDTLEKYLDKESVLDALTRFEYIKTNPVVLDIIFKRAIEEGVYANLLQKPSALTTFAGESKLPSTTPFENHNSRRKSNLTLKSLKDRINLTDDEKMILQKQMSRLSEKDKEYVESVINKLKNKDESKTTSEQTISRKRGTATENTNKDSNGNSSNKTKTSRFKYIDDELLQNISKIESNQEMSSAQKILDISELCLDKVYGNGFSRRFLKSDELRKNIERQIKCEEMAKLIADDESLLSSFNEIVSHITKIMTNNFPIELYETADIQKYVLPDNYLMSVAKAETTAKLCEEISSLANQISRYNDKILHSKYELYKTKNDKNNLFFKFNQIFFNEANINLQLLEFVSQVRKAFKNHTDEILNPELLKEISEKMFNPIIPVTLFIATKEMRDLSENEIYFLKSDEFGLKNSLMKKTPLSTLDTLNIGKRSLHDDSPYSTQNQSMLKHEALKCCFLVAQDSGTGKWKFDKKVNNTILDITGVEYDDKGIYVKFKKGFTLLYPQTPDKEFVEKMKLKPASQGTKELPCIKMKQDTVYDDLEKNGTKTFKK